jgi:ribosomal protein S27E
MRQASPPSINVNGEKTSRSCRKTLQPAQAIERTGGQGVDILELSRIGPILASLHHQLSWNFAELFTMNSAANARITLAIECPACGEYSEKQLVALKAARAVDCEVCGGAIDVESGDYRTEIDALLEQIEHVGY